MVIVRFILGVVAFAIAIKILGVLLTIVGFALGLIKLAVILAIFVVLGWLIYRVISPRSAQQI